MTAVLLATYAPVHSHDHPVTAYLSGLAAGSRRTMRTALATMARILSPGANEMTLAWSDLRYAHTQALRSVLAGRYAPATANKHLAALRRVLKECFRLGLLAPEAYRQAVDLAPVRGHRLPRGRGLSAGELRALFFACAADDAPSGRRDAALFGLLYGAGLRRAEATGLVVGDFRPGEGFVKVRGKGGKERLVPLPVGAQRALTTWLATRGPHDGPLLVVVRKGGMVGAKALSTQAVWKRLVLRATQAGIAKVSPHDLRRSYVSDLLDAGADLAIVQQLAGHASPTTTARYDRRGDTARQRAADLLHVPV